MGLRLIAEWIWAGRTEILAELFLQLDMRLQLIVGWVVYRNLMEILAELFLRKKEET